MTPYAEYPAKGRATGGVRCHRFLKGEDLLVLAWAGPGASVRSSQTANATNSSSAGGGAKVGSANAPSASGLDQSIDRIVRRVPPADRFVVENLDLFQDYDVMLDYPTLEAADQLQSQGGS